MNKMLCGLFVLVLAAVFPGLALAEKGNAPAREILTAIDVADLIKSGSSDAEISKLLSGQRGFDRESALKKGNTDQFIINFLLDDNRKKILDKNKSARHKFEGNKYFRESKFDKAASEYTLAIKYSKDDYALYKSRADSYKQYLMTKMPVAAGGAQAGAKPASLDKARLFLCAGIYSDFKKAMEINRAEIKNNESRLNVLETSMDQKNMSNLIVGKVVPSRSNAAGNIQGMRELDRLYRAQRINKHNDINIRKEMSDYKQFCGEEDKASGESLKLGKTNAGQ